MAGARPSGTVPLADAMFNDDEEENSADSVEQAALEGARRDESLLDPDSLMFEELDDDRQLITEDEDEEITMVRKGREYDDQGAASAGPSYDDPDSILNTPYGSPLSDVSSISNNQKWIGEVKKMLLEDQRKTENRTKTWVSNPGEPIPPLGSVQLGPSEGQSHWNEQFEDSLPEIGFDLPSAEELAEKYSNDLIEKDLLILEKDKHISTLEKTQRELKSTLEDCQKELHIKSEAATSGVEQIKRSLEEKDRCIMETSEKLRKVTESYNSSEKRWKEQQEFLEKQIKKLKSELDEKGTHDEELKRMTDVAILEKQELEQKLEQAREETALLKQQFDDEKKILGEKLEKLEDEKTELIKVREGLEKLKDKLSEEIEALTEKLSKSELVAEKALNDNERNQCEIEYLKERIRLQKEDLESVREDFSITKAEIMHEHSIEKANLEGALEMLKQEKEENRQHCKLLIRELRYEKEVLQEQLEKAKQRPEVTSDDDAPVNFFKQDNEAASTEPWTDTKKTLEDRIAELELEKGNLLLQLVDVDEHEQQDAKRNAEITAVAEENAMQLEASKKALEELEKKHEILEKELEETKTRETQRIENAMNTIAWEEKYEELQKQNQSLLEELQSQRQAADDLSGRYEELEKKCTDLELGKVPIEGLADIDKCDGWSDGAPQLPDEGFTEMETQISELKEALKEKQNVNDEMFALVNELKEKLTERTSIICGLEENVAEITAEKTSCSEKLKECMAELERTQKELLEKATEQQVVATESVTVESADGWNDDPPVLLDEGFNDDNQIAELKQELAKKEEELTTTTEKCRGMEDKLKKALRALKQKNEKLAELKNRLGDDPMTASTISSMESSVVLEPAVEKSITSDLGSSISSTSLQVEMDRLKRECEEKDAKIRDYLEKEEDMKNRNVECDKILDENRDVTSSLHQRDLEIQSLRNQLTQLATTLGSKNEEVEQLMKACEEMQKSIDEKVELLNDCVSKKDVEVRQAISQYEDMLKDTTLNVSHLTKELEELIRERNSLQAQLLDAQQQTLEVQNEYDRYREDKESGSDSLEEKLQELDQLKREHADLQSQAEYMEHQVQENFHHITRMTEAMDQAEAEKKQLREEFLCVQNEFGTKTKEMQVHISELIDHLNEREAAVSVMEARLKESDEQAEKMNNEIKQQLEEKSKALEQAEQNLFVKTEEVVRLEERLRETDEYYRREMNNKLTELQEQHRIALEAYATQTSEDLERTCEQLAKKNSEVVGLQEQLAGMQGQLAGLQSQLTVMQGDYSNKCAELSQTEVMASEINSLQQTIETLKQSLESYTQAFNNASAELNVKNNEISDMRTICGQYEEKYYNITVTQESTQRALQEAQAALAQCQQEMGTLYNDLQNLQGEKDMLRNSQVESEQTIEKLNGELTEAKTEAARQANETQSRANELAKYHDIEANLNRYLEDLNSATEELGKRNSEYRELEKSCKAQEVQIQSLQQSVEATRKELADLEEKVAEKNDLIARFEAQVVELQASAQQQQQQGLSPEMSKELLEELEEKKREISDLRFELDEGIIQEKRLKEHLESRENEIRQLKNVISEKDSEIAETWQSWKDNQSQPALPEEVGSGDGGPVMERLEQAEKDKEALERKIDLLQNKLEEVEDSEIKCYEDFSRLKVLRTELEMDNLRMSAELEQLRRSLQDGDNDPKYKSMENQLILMTKTLEDRDKLCRDLLKNISQLQESYDVLRIRVNSMTLPQPFALSPDSLEAKFVEQDREIFSLRVDLEREKKIRELYEGQLFLATSKKQFENSTRKSTSSGSWFGLGELFSSPSPPRPSPAPSSRSSVSTSLAPPPASAPQNLDHSSASPYGGGRPITPLTPATAFSASLFDNSGLAGQGQQQYFVPQASPGPSSAQGAQYFIPQMQPSPSLSPGQGTQPAQSSPPGVVESPYANFPNQP